MDDMKRLQDAGIEPDDVLNGLGSIIIVTSLDGQVLYLNREALRTFRLSKEDASGKHLDALVPALNWNSIGGTLSDGLLNKRLVRLADVVLETNGSEIILGFSALPITGAEGRISAFLLHGSDITVKRNLERQLVQTSKMATIGEMATGIAHEINQPLNIMKLASQRLEDAVKEGYDDHDFIKERTAVIIEQIHRISGIIEHIKEFGRKGDDFIPVNINDPIRNACRLLGEQMRSHGIEYVFNLDDSLPAITGNSSRLEQLFINLLVNSRDALAERSGEGAIKKITIFSIRDAIPGMLKVEYMDNGPGIAPENIDRIFEPFFTTKKGIGTGLGLSICASIASEHRGIIRAELRPNGAVFVLQLPFINKEKKK
jgi:histidine kinase